MADGEEQLGDFTIQRVKNRLDRVKALIDANDFSACSVKKMKDIWEAEIEVLEILIAAMVILLHKTTITIAQQAPPKTVQDRLWAVVERSPMSAALIFLGVVILKVFGHGGDVVQAITKGL